MGAPDDPRPAPAERKPGYGRAKSYGEWTCHSAGKLGRSAGKREPHNGQTASGRHRVAAHSRRDGEAALTKRTKENNVIKQKILTSS